jgi:hypothetical protein
MPSVKADAARVEATRAAGAAMHGWEVDAKENRCGTERQLGPKALIALALDDDAIFGKDDVGLGPLLWWYLSGVVHSSPYALMQSVDASAGGNSAVTGEQVASIFTSGQAVLMVGLTAGRGYRAAVNEHAGLMGWNSERWQMAQLEFAKLADMLPS